MILLFLYAFVVVIFFILFNIYWKFIRPQKRLYDAFRQQGVPGEPFVPLIGQLPEMRRASENDAGPAYRMKLVEKHGYVYLTGFGPYIRVSIMEPDMIADILGRSHASDYMKPTNIDQVFKQLIGVHNLLVAEGSEHTRARKMLNPAFHYANLQSMVSIIADQTSKAINELLLLSTQEKVIDLQPELNTLTLAIIASSAFGKGFKSMADAKEVVCRTFTEVLGAVEYRTMRMIHNVPVIGQLPFWRKNISDKGCQKISAFVDQIITDRRQGQSTSLCESGDILDLLLSAVDDQGQPFTHQEIKDQALTFVLAGHETTGNLLTWVMYVLMTNEQVLQACRDEVDRVLPNNIQLTNEHLNDLVVCDAVIQETLRLYPPAPFLLRRCIREHCIGSEGQRQLDIPLNAIVLINTYVLHRRADFWSRPLEFDYTRWMRDPVTDFKPKLSHPFCYLPFAAGPRNCIGQNFALLEAKIVLASLLQRCDFEMEPGQKIVPDVRITMRPKYGLRARITKRL